MRDISHKEVTLRTAKAKAMLYCSHQTLDKLLSNEVPKEGLPFEIARSAAFLAIKKTFSIIPHCHPIPIEGASVSFHTSKTEEYGIIDIINFAKCRHRTGIEMEVLHGASVAALVLYDLLKVFKDNQLCIKEICLLEKTGGSSDQN